MIFSKTCLTFLVGAILQINFARAGSNCDDNSKLQYEAGKSYGYNIHLVTHDSHVHHGGHGHDHHHLHTFRGPKMETPKTKGKIITKGGVVLTALENCEFVLTLNNVKQEIQVDRDFTKMPITTREHAVPRTSVRFTYKNGEVSGLQGAQNGREPWTDNILRGILTMIQNKAMSNTDGEPVERETNIKGDCVAKVYIPKEGTYHKNIDGGQCSEAIVSPLVTGVPYTNPVYTHVAGHHHRLKSHIRCMQKVEQGKLSRANCTETDHVPMTHHKMDTLSSIVANDTAGAGGATPEEISSLNQAMLFTYDMSQNTLGEGPKFFQAIADLAKTMYNDPEANKAELYQKLKEMLHSIKDFSQLEKSLEKASGQDTLQIQFVKNIVREAATEIGSEAAVVYLAKLITNKTLDQGPQIAFYTKLPYSRDPTVKGLGALVGNLEAAYSNYQNDTFFSFHFGEKKRIRKMMIGTSAYAYQFCRRNPDCAAVPEYQNLVNLISQFCNSKQPEISPACLHSLGNVEHLPEKAVGAIKTILQSKGELLVGLSKKITAFEAFRRDPCQPELKALARQDMLSSENSQDLRIVAYMAVARCPTEEDLSSIDKILEDQYDSPLSSFIASHVYNIMDSQSPSKSYLKSTPLNQIGIPAKVPTAHNKTTASRFIEYSHFRPESNTGFSADGYAIFKDDGTGNLQFLHLNVTVDWLGKSYNKLQVGLSKRYLPRMEKLNFFLKHHKKAQWIAKTIIPTLFSVDSYYRLYGTTISMGIDLFDTFKPQEFFDRMEDKETGLMRMDLVKPLTIWDKEVIFPTISGTPITMSSQAVYLPVLSLNHTGDPNGLGIFDLLSKWDDKSGQFNHKSRSNSAFYLKSSMSTGKGTPLSMAYNMEVKVHCNHSIGFESMKNLSTNWVKKVEFPDHVVWSKRFTLARTFTMNDGTEQVTNWPVYGDMKPETPHRLFSYEGMGLKFTGERLKHHHWRDGDVIFMLEKTDDKFTGYSLDIESKQNGDAKSYDIKLKADGLSSEDTLHVNFDKTVITASALKNDADQPKSEYTLRTEVTSKNKDPSGIRFHYTSVGFPKSSLDPTTLEVADGSILSIITHGHLIRQSYSLQVESWCHSSKFPLLDWSGTNKPDFAQVTLKFQGPLKPAVGTITGQVSIPKSNEIQADSRIQSGSLNFNAEFTHERGAFGKNTLKVDYAYGKGDLQINTTATLRDQWKYSLTQHIPRAAIERTSDASGNVLTQLKSYRYNAHYHDIFNKRETFVTLGSDENLQETSSLFNQSLRITGSRHPPISVETSVYEDFDRTRKNYHDGLARWMGSVYINVLDKHQAELSYDRNYTERASNGEHCSGHYVYTEQGEQRCSTSTISSSILIPKKIDFNSSFSNVDQRKTEIDMSFRHTHPDYSGDLKVTTEIPEGSPSKKIHTTIWNLENVPPGHKWAHNSKTEIDHASRTLKYKAATNESPDKKDWSVTVDANWAQNLLDGDSKAKIVHTCPQKKTVTVDILNQAKSPKQSEGIFNNTLTATIDVVGRTREFTPKRQFTWILTSDNSRTEEEKKKHEYGVKTTSDIKWEHLGGGSTSEKFRLSDNAQVTKQMGKPIWGLNGQGNMFINGKENSAWDWDMDIKMGEKVEESQTAVANKSPSKTSVNWRGNGWFETDYPAARNNTWSSKYASQMTIVDEIKIAKQFEFEFRKIDMSTGHVMMSVDTVGTKDIKFKDWLHFSSHEVANITVDNKTTNVVQDVVVNGPHLTVYLTSGNHKENQDLFVIDFAGGIYEEKHQHKFNMQSGSKYHHEKIRHSSHHSNSTSHHHGHRPHHSTGDFSVTNFNYTISK